MLGPRSKGRGLFFFGDNMDCPYENITRLLREFKHLNDEVNSNLALEVAMQIRLEAQKLVVLAAKNVDTVNVVVKP